MQTAPVQCATWVLVSDSGILQLPQVFDSQTLYTTIFLFE